MCVLKTLRWIQRLIGVLLIATGIYLIFGTQEFFGTLLIIIAFLIFPNVSEKRKSTDPQDVQQQDHFNCPADEEYLSEESMDSGSDSTDRGGR